MRAMKKFFYLIMILFVFKLISLGFNAENTSAKQPVQSLNSTSFSNDVWTSTDEGFGAMFPSTPEKVYASTTTGSGYSYQSTKKFANGGALYAITIIPFSKKIALTNKEFIVEINAGFIRGMGENPSDATMNWAVFGDGRPQLNYKVGFLYKDTKFTGTGFWILDKERSIRVSVAYTEGLTEGEIKETTNFLQTFTLLRK